MGADGCSTGVLPSHAKVLHIHSRSSISGLTILLIFNMLSRYILGYISKHLLSESLPGDVMKYVECASKRFERVGKAGAKRGQQPPTAAEIELAKVCGKIACVGRVVV